MCERVLRYLRETEIERESERQGGGFPLSSSIDAFGLIPYVYFNLISLLSATAKLATFANEFSASVLQPTVEASTVERASSKVRAEANIIFFMNPQNKKKPGPLFSLPRYETTFVVGGEATTTSTMLTSTS